MSATLTPEQENDLRRLKAYFPYRICFAALTPETGEVETFADHTRRRMNQLARAGKLIFALQ